MQAGRTRRNTIRAAPLVAVRHASAASGRRVEAPVCRGPEPGVREAALTPAAAGGAPNGGRRERRGGTAHREATACTDTLVLTAAALALAAAPSSAPRSCASHPCAADRRHRPAGHVTARPVPHLVGRRLQPAPPLRRRAASKAPPSSATSTTSRASAWRSGRSGTTASPPASASRCTGRRRRVTPRPGPSSGSGRASREERPARA
jgi:hypothetical protein